MDIELVKKLREKTLASLKDCKEALIQSEWNIDHAMDWLKKKWLSNASKKADRDTSDGIIRVSTTNKKLVAVVIWCETDFVAKNEIFLNMCDDVLGMLDVIPVWTTVDTIDDTLMSKISERMSDSIAKLWENMKIVELICYDMWEHEVVPYLHNGGKIASIVVYDAHNDNAPAVAKQVALHIAAMNPTYHTMDQISASEIEALTHTMTQELLSTGKPADMIEKIVQGKLSKQLGENVLMKQWYIGDEAVSIEKLIDWTLTFVTAFRFSI